MLEWAKVVVIIGTGYPHHMENSLNGTEWAEHTEWVAQTGWGTSSNLLWH